MLFRLSAKEGLPVIQETVMFFSFFFSCFWIFFVFIWSYYLLVQMDKERGGEREGESHAAKVLMNGTRTCNMLSG